VRRRTSCPSRRQESGGPDRGQVWPRRQSEVAGLGRVRGARICPTSRRAHNPWDPVVLATAGKPNALVRNDRRKSVLGTSRSIPELLPVRARLIRRGGGKISRSHSGPTTRNQAGYK